MRQAVLDIGTNTVKLLVAEIIVGEPSPAVESSVRGRRNCVPTIIPIREDSLTTRIGQGVHQTRQLNPAAVERTLTAIAQFAQRARELGARKILAFATSAVRDARNAQQFLDAAKARAGVTVNILSGDEEARYCFAGVASDPMFAGKTIRTIDIGGGSTEICVGSCRPAKADALPPKKTKQPQNPLNISTPCASLPSLPSVQNNSPPHIRSGNSSALQAHKSLNIGAVRLTEMFCSSDPISESEFAEMSEHAANALQQLPKELLQPGPTAGLIATGGTATTLAAIDANRIHPPRAGARHTVETPRVEVDHYELANLAELLDWLRKLPLAERRKIPGLPPARADIIVAGATILLEAMRCFGANTVAISARGARYGALMLNQ